MKPPVTLLGPAMRVLRVVLYTFLVGLAAYVVWRYDLVELPAEGCSPVEAFEPGDRLLVDLRGVAGAGDTVLFRGRAGELLLGRVDRPPPSAPEGVWAACATGALWVLADRPGCPGPDSRTLGPVGREAVAGRVALVLPW